MQPWKQQRLFSWKTSQIQNGTNHLLKQDSWAPFMWNPTILQWQEQQPLWGNAGNIINEGGAYITAQISLSVLPCYPPCEECIWWHVFASLLSWMWANCFHKPWSVSMSELFRMCLCGERETLSMFEPNHWLIISPQMLWSLWGAAARGKWFPWPPCVGRPVWISPRCFQGKRFPVPLCTSQKQTKWNERRLTLYRQLQLSNDFQCGLSGRR